MHPDRRFACSCGSGERGDAFDFAPASGARPLHYHQCKNCGLWQMWPQPDDEALSAAYSSSYYGATPRKFIGPVAAIVAAAQRGRANFVLRHLARPAPRILDVGCGNGGFLAAAGRLGARCEGTELSAESAARASGLPDVIIHPSGLDALVARDRSYDGITMWHVIEHMRDPDGDVAIAAALLPPGGLLFVSAPNHESWQAKVFRHHWFHLDPPRHLWGFSPRSLTTMLRRHGLKPIAHTTMSFEQNPYGIVQSILNRAGLPHNRAYETLKGSWSSLVAATLDVSCVASLALPAVIAASVEAFAGRGGTFCLVARKDEDV